jgi:hypothetical protein
LCLSEPSNTQNARFRRPTSNDTSFILRRK